MLHENSITDIGFFDMTPEVESSFGAAEANGQYIKSKDTIEYERACAQFSKAS